MPWNGGLVQEGEIHVYLTFWGSAWNEHPGDKEHVLDLFRYLNGSPYSGLLTQYFDHAGHPNGQVSLRSYTDGSVTTPEFVSQTKIELEAKKSIESQGWPAPTFNSTYVVLPAPGATEQVGFNTGCARHGFDSELGAPFTFVWFPTGEHSACLEGRQPWEILQVGNAFEWAQAATDPQPYNTFGSTVPSGWLKPKPEEVHEGKVATYEIGEVCKEAGVVEQAPGIWLPRVRDNYLLAEQGIECAAQDKEPVRYSLSVGGTQFPEPNKATVSGTVIPGGWTARYRFVVSDPAIGYSATVPAEFQPVTATKTGETVTAKLPTVTGGQTYSVTLESYNALTEADPPLSTSNSVLTASGSFTTPAWPTASTGAASSVAATSARLEGSVNPDGISTTYKFEYGPTTKYGASTSVASAGSGSSQQTVSATVAGLKAATTYHFRVVATNSSGTVYGADQVFNTTSGPPEVGAEVTVLWQPSKTPRLVEPFGKVNPGGLRTLYYFEYGTSSSYGYRSQMRSVGPERTSGENIYTFIADGAPGIESQAPFHYRLVAENALGRAVGADHVVTAPNLAPAAISLPATGESPGSATFNGSVDPEGQATTYYFKVNSVPSFSTAVQSAGAGTTAVPVHATVSGLPWDGTPIVYRLVAENASGVVESKQQIWVGPGRGPTASNPTLGHTASSISISGTVNPEGSSASYRLCARTTPAHNEEQCLPWVEIGSGFSPVGYSHTFAVPAFEAEEFYLIIQNLKGTRYLYYEEAAR